MKKDIIFANWAAVLLLLLCLPVLSACGKTNADETKQFEHGSSAEKIEGPSASKMPNNEESPAPVGSGGAGDEVVALHLNKTIFAEYEFPEQEGGCMLQIGDAYLELEDGDADRYPALADILAEEERSVKAAVTENIAYLSDRYLSQVEYFGDGDINWIVETADIRVCRADSVALSVLDIYEREEFGESSRNCYGRTLDTQTGRTLYLSDVIRDMDALPSLVEQILVDYVFGGDFYSETAVADYFADRNDHSYNWTLEYNGVSIHFNPGDIADPVYGAMTATIYFAEHPELFEERYMAVPEAYIVALPDEGYYVDVNDDGANELLTMWGEEAEETEAYSGFGIGLSPIGNIFSIEPSDTFESVFAYGYYPYYVKTADGGHYLYVFYQDSYELDWKMQLLVYNLSDSGITKAGECDVRPYYQPKIGEISDCFSIPTDPETLYLDDFDDPTRTYSFRTDNESDVQEYDLNPPVAFMAGSDGVPVRK